MDRQNRVCADCGSVNFVEDRAQGDVTCTGCGLVAESHIIDEGAEWRSFADSDKAGADMNRVGGAVNPFMTDGLGLSIGEAQKGNVSASGFQALKRTHARGTDPDRVLHQAGGVIGRLSDALQLKANIRNRATQLFSQILHLKLTRGRSLESICCAILYTACRLEKTPRTFKEIMQRAQSATQKDVSRCYKAIEKFLQEDAAKSNGDAKDIVGVLHVSDLLRRYCSQLGLGHADMRTAIAIAEAACPRENSPNRPVRTWDARSPLSMSGGIIFLLTRLSKTSLHPSPHEIAQVVGISEGTVKSVYHELRPFATEIIPASCASTEELLKLT